MIATSALPPTFVPSFSFITDKGRERYRPDKAVEVMKAAYARRNKVLSGAEEAMVEYALQTAQEAEGAA